MNKRNILLIVFGIIIVIILFILLLFNLDSIFYSKQKKIFLTYGNNNFKKSRERIKNEANSLNIFDDCIIETDKNILNDIDFKKTLTNDYFKKVFESNRGGGYWIWKPYIIHKHLSELNDGDILVYSDAGCKIENNSKTIQKFNEIFNNLNENKYNMTLNIYGDNEKVWSKGDILKYHNIYDNEKRLNEPHYEANRIFLIKNDKTMEVISKWWDIGKNQPELFDDSESVIPNKKEFKRTSWDQSHISILCKLHDECIGQDLNCIKTERIRE